jgi:hypothetical protein
MDVLARGQLQRAGLGLPNGLTAAPPASYPSANLLALLIAASTPFFSLSTLASALCLGLSCRM